MFGRVRVPARRFVLTGADICIHAGRQERRPSRLHTGLDRGNVPLSIMRIHMRPDAPAARQGETACRQWRDSTGLDMY